MNNYKRFTLNSTTAVPLWIQYANNRSQLDVDIQLKLIITPCILFLCNYSCNFIISIFLTFMSLDTSTSAPSPPFASPRRYRHYDSTFFYNLTFARNASGWNLHGAIALSESFYTMYKIDSKSESWGPRFIVPLYTETFPLACSLGKLNRLRALGPSSQKFRKASTLIWKYPSRSDNNFLSSSSHSTISARTRGCVGAFK